MNLTVSEIVALCGGRLRVGEPEFLVKGAAALEQAGPDDLSFLGNEKYFNDYLATKAGVVLTVEKAPVAREGLVVIDVENPSLAFSQVLEASQTQRFFEAGVHPSAYVHETADCLLYTSPSPRDLSTSRMPSSA